MNNSVWELCLPSETVRINSKRFLNVQKSTCHTNSCLLGAPRTRYVWYLLWFTWKNKLACQRRWNARWQFHIHLFKSSLWITQWKTLILHFIRDVFSFELVQVKIPKAHQWQNNLSAKERSFTCSSQDSDGYAGIRSERKTNNEKNGRYASNNCNDRRGLNNIWKRVDLRFQYN